MSQPGGFVELLRRARAGDQDAATQLVRQYEPALRLAIRVRLTDPGLRRLVDSLDICNSILGNFFVRVASGQYELETPEQLLKLLSKMAHNKIIDVVHKYRAAKRDYRLTAEGVDELEIVANQPSPSSVVAHRELLQEVRKRLTEEERRLADYRVADRSWNEIAAEMGGHPNALRMRLERAVDRVMKELRLDA